MATSRDALMRGVLVEVLEPDADLVAEQGEWLLFHSKHPIVPLLSAEVRPPAEMETVADRVKIVQNNVRKEMGQ